MVYPSHTDICGIKKPPVNKGAENKYKTGEADIAEGSLRFTDSNLSQAIPITAEYTAIRKMGCQHAKIIHPPDSQAAVLLPPGICYNGFAAQR
jgi:hypothetical protein